MERKQREDNEQSVLDKLREMTDRIRQEIESEHTEREDNFETLLNLLEDKTFHGL